MHNNIELEELKNEKKKTKNKINFNKYKIKKIDELVNIKQLLITITMKNYKLIKLSRCYKDQLKRHGKNLLVEKIEEIEEYELHRVAPDYKLRGRKFNEPVFLIQNKHYEESNVLFEKLHQDSALYKHMDHFIHKFLIVNINLNITRLEKKLNLKEKTVKDREEYLIRKDLHRNTVNSNRIRKLNGREQGKGDNSVDKRNGAADLKLIVRDKKEFLASLKKKVEKSERLLRQNDEYDTKHNTQIR